MFSPCIFTLYLMISIDPKTQPWGWKYANHGVSLTRTSRDVSTLGHMILSTVFKSFSSTFSFHFFLLLFLKCKIRFRTYFILHPLHPLKQCLNQNIQIAYPVGLPVMLNRMRVPRILSAGVILTRFILFLNTFFSQFVETILLPIILSGGPIPIRLDVGFPFSHPFLTSLKIKKIISWQVLHFQAVYGFFLVLAIKDWCANNAWISQKSKLALLNFADKVCFAFVKVPYTRDIYNGKYLFFTLDSLAFVPHIWKIIVLHRKVGYRLSPLLPF